MFNVDEMFRAEGPGMRQTQGLGREYSEGPVLRKVES